MTSLVLGDLILESLTPSVNARSEILTSAGVFILIQIDKIVGTFINGRSNQFESSKS
jgi:hypothetical protein